MLLGWNPKRLPWLLELKETYHTYILSNTNAMHIDWVRKDLKKNHGVTDFESTYFDCVHYSHNMGMQKPDIRIFNEVIAANSINSNEALYIDDNKENVAAAASTGLHAVWHDPSLEIMDELPKYINSIK